ncbi:MAG TPA: phosphoenolpyruvate--protein phosphotransferase, partial [Spirochaetota bacterium]|nr:phosphoenolpyruvate--protein phosphotransferase [Spirochaetota bacterium]
MKRIKGNSVTSGIGIGKAFIHYYDITTHVEKKELPQSQIKKELLKFENIKFNTKRSFEKINKNLSGYLQKEAAQFLVSHEMIIDDVSLNQDITNIVTKNKCNIEYAIYTAFEDLIKKFSKIDNAYLKERTYDLKEIRKRLLAHSDCCQQSENWINEIKQPVVLVADEIGATDLLSFNPKKIRGIITEKGSRFSHATILAKSFEIPTIIQVRNATRQINNNNQVIIDTNKDTVYIKPTSKTLERFLNLRDKAKKIKKRLESAVHKSIFTKDQQHIFISANVEDIKEAEICLNKGIYSVGLYRSEFLFISRSKLLNENEQFKAYHKLTKAFKDKTVTIRTLDLGGDKILGHPPYQEENPLLGYRAIRYTLEKHAVFDNQIKAILRASHYGKVQIMLPMISSYDELGIALKLIKKNKNQLKKKHIPFDENIKIGIMVEVPSAVLILKDLLQKIDFISIGTNDLIQYTVAVDRNNSLVSKLFQPLHPAVLSLIQKCTEAAWESGKEVSICGEVGGDPFYIPVLLGLGLKHFSMSATSILKVKNVIQELDIRQCKKLAHKMLNSPSVKSNKQMLIN